MKRTCRLLLHRVVGIFLLAGGAVQCFAEMMVAPVNQERAKEMGIAVRLIGDGPTEVVVQVELKAEGALKDFSHVSLEIREGGKLLIGYAPLREKRSDSGVIAAQFMANRTFLEKVTLRVVAGQTRDYRGYDLRVSEVAETKKP